MKARTSAAQVLNRMSLWVPGSMLRIAPAMGEDDRTNESLDRLGKTLEFA
jgi:hypothetical protein